MLFDGRGHAAYADPGHRRLWRWPLGVSSGCSTIAARPRLGRRRRRRRAPRRRRGHQPVLPDPRALRHVALVGATPVESAAVRDLLPLLGPDPGSTGSPSPTARGSRAAATITQPTGDPQRVWLGDVFARNVVARLRDHGDTVAVYGFTGRPGTAVSALAATSEDALGRAVATATASLRRVRAHADLTVYPIGAVAVTLQLDERAMLGDQRADWLGASGDHDGDDIARYLDVLAPDGTRIYYRGASTCAGVCGGPPHGCAGHAAPGRHRLAVGPDHPRHAAVPHAGDRASTRGPARTAPVRRRPTSSPSATRSCSTATGCSSRSRPGRAARAASPTPP